MINEQLQRQAYQHLKISDAQKKEVDVSVDYLMNRAELDVNEIALHINRMNEYQGAYYARANKIIDIFNSPKLVLTAQINWVGIINTQFNNQEEKNKILEGINIQIDKTSREIQSTKNLVGNLEKQIMNSNLRCYFMHQLRQRLSSYISQNSSFTNEQKELYTNQLVNPCISWINEHDKDMAKYIHGAITGKAMLEIKGAQIEVYNIKKQTLENLIPVQELTAQFLKSVTGIGEDYTKESPILDKVNKLRPNPAVSMDNEGNARTSGYGDSGQGNKNQKGVSI